VRADPVPAFRHGLVLIIALFAGAGLVAAALLAARPRGAPTPQAPAEAPAAAAPVTAPAAGRPISKS
jgi:hypothetical protein